VVTIKQGSLKVWDKVKCSVSAAARKATARNHTATHLVHAALRTILGDHVKQAGSLVSPDRMRFDFAHFYGLEKQEISDIEDIVNAAILENSAVETEVSDIQDALKSGVIALFGEKYGDTVRIVRVPGVSAELCGGTHCTHTGDIGLFAVVSESSVASGIRRLEAVTGKAAFELLREKRDELKKIGELLKSDKPAERVEKVLADLKDREKEIDTLKAKSASQDSLSIVGQAQEIGGVKVLSTRVADMDAKDLRVLADNVRDRLGSCVLVLASVKEGQAALVAMVTKELATRFSAGELLKNVAAQVGGRGGGKPEMAQGGVAGITDPAPLDAALASVYALCK
jgi:alanyl-tRNA synthetase